MHKTPAESGKGGIEVRARQPIPNLPMPQPIRYQGVAADPPDSRLLPLASSGCRRSPTVVAADGVIPIR